MAGVRIACVNGFLGSGKTSALAAAAREMTSRGLRVGIITNDQGSHLVDTGVMRSLGLPTEEISGGCFCCRFDQFVQHADRILRRGQPQVILAEAVGSCTDLAATVYRPLQKYYREQFDLAPLSVLVDPERLKAFSHPRKHGFPESVRYLFARQLMEADIIVFNKSDLVTLRQRKPLMQDLRQRFGKTPVYMMSARRGWGVAKWVDQLLGKQPAGEQALDLDYKVYADAEASLGWLNATVDLESDLKFSPRKFGEAFLHKILTRCRKESKAIAHLKVLLATEDRSDRIAVTETRGQAAWAGKGSFIPVRAVSMIINARVCATPEALQDLTVDTLASAAGEQGIAASIQYLESFAPPPPNPPYRLQKSATG